MTGFLEVLWLNVQNFSQSLKILVVFLSYRYANIHIHSFVAAYDNYTPLVQFKCTNFAINKYYIYKLKY